MLEILGVDRWGEGAYLALVDSPALTVDELESLTGIERQALAPALARLEDHGLISRLPGRPVRYSALPPEPAVEVLLLSRERDIQRVRALARRLAERHRKSQVGRDASTLIEVIVGQDGVARCGQQLFRRAEREVRGIDAPPYAQASDGEPVNSSRNIGGRRVRSRFIHAHATLTTPGATERIERDIAAGEEVRFLPEAPMKMIIVDDQAGLIPLLATPQVLDSCILVHPSALLDALSTLFETLWQQAQPFVPEQGAGGAGEFINDEERRIVSLLAMGLPDETIARQLNIGHRTVQRRIQALMLRLGAASRFQAGVLAAQRGWWNPDERPRLPVPPHQAKGPGLLNQGKWREGPVAGREGPVAGKAAPPIL